MLSSYSTKNHDQLTTSKSIKRNIFRKIDTSWKTQDMSQNSLIYSSCFDSYLEFSKMSLFFGMCFILSYSTQEKLSESLTGIEPVTCWSPMRRSNHWATCTQMVSEGYIYVLIRIDGRHMYCQFASLDMLSMCFSDHWLALKYVDNISRLADWQYLCLPSIRTGT